jgi:hypothetical protein
MGLWGPTQKNSWQIGRITVEVYSGYKKLLRAVLKK